MPDPILQAIDTYLRGLRDTGYRPTYEFAWASGGGEDSSGDLYVRPYSEEARQRWGNPGYYGIDPTAPEGGWTQQDYYTEQVPGARRITEAEITADPTMAQDWQIWNEYLGNYQRRQEPFNLFTSDIFPALAALGLSTGLAGAMGAFSAPAAGAAPVAGAEAGPGILTGTEFLGPGMLGPETITIYGPSGAALGTPLVDTGGALLGGLGGAAGGAGALTPAMLGPETMTVAGPAGAAGGSPLLASGAVAPVAGGAGMGAMDLLWPALIQGGTSLLGGLLGSEAARDAGETQAQAARDANALLAGIYAQNRADLEPWRQTGMTALSQLLPLTQTPMPTTTYQAPGAMNLAPYDLNALVQQTRFQAPVGVLDPTQYAWTPPAALQAANYQYTPPEALNPAGYRFAPPTGQQVLQQDPGYQFRQDEARRALEASAAARGGLLSGNTLRGVTELSQNLASQEYQNAYNRLLAQNQLDYARALQQSQDIYGRGLTQDQLNYARALQESQDVYGRGLTANQLAYGRGYQQNQDLYNRGLTENQMNFERLLTANQGQYGRAYQADVDNYQRQLQQYLLNYNQQMGQRERAYNELSNLAGMGQTSTSVLSQLGTGLGTQQAANLLSGGAAQAGGQMGAMNAWLQGLGGVSGAANTYLGNTLLANLLQRRS